MITQDDYVTSSSSATDNISYYRISYPDNDFGYQFGTGRTGVGVHFLAEIIEPLLDDLDDLFMAVKVNFVCVTDVISDIGGDGFNRIQNDDRGPLWAKSTA